jgi:hypothetical protein
VGLSLSQRDRDAQRIGARERMDRLRAFSPDQMAAGQPKMSPGGGEG